MANGDITYSNVGAEIGATSFASGRYTGLATSNIDILCGFIPSRIIIRNDTDDTIFEWFTGVEQGSMFRTTIAGVPSLEVLGTLGAHAPTPLDNSSGESTGRGFRVPLGTTTQINTTADDCYWLAWK